jgi:CHAT domain-containing protein
LLLQDKPLSVLALTGLRPADAELAFLWACQTAGGRAVLVDEAVHLAAALQVGGFRHVIATLWPLYDSIAPEVTRHFYGELLTESTAGAAKVLRDAVRALRDGSGRGLPATWAPYIHIGP